MFLVIANKNLFLFSKCGASVLFCRIISPACRHQVEAEDLRKVGTGSWAGTWAACELKRELFPQKGSWCAVKLKDRLQWWSHKMVRKTQLLQ